MEYVQYKRVDLSIKDLSRQQIFDSIFIIIIIVFIYYLKIKNNDYFNAKKSPGGSG